MKKIVKRTTMLALSLLMLVSYVTQPVLASDLESRSRVCGVCGEGIMITEKTYSSWTVVGKADCEHYVYGQDITWQRYVYSQTVCSICQQGYSNPTTTETKVVCNGSNTP